MDTLYPDLKKHLLTFVDRWDRLPLSFVSKEWNSLVNQIELNESDDRNDLEDCSRNHYSLEAALKYRSIALLDWLFFDLKYPTKPFLSDFPSQSDLNNKIEIMEWLSSKGLKLNMRECAKGFAVNGSVEGLKYISRVHNGVKLHQWWKAFSFPLSDSDREWFDGLNLPLEEWRNASVCAIKEGQIQNVNWMMSKGVDMNIHDHVIAALGSGNLQLIELILSQREGLSQLDLVALTQKGHWDLFWRFFINSPENRFDAATRHAAEQGNIEQMKTLVEAGFQLYVDGDSQTTIDYYAARNNHWDMVYWIYEKSGLTLPHTHYGSFLTDLSISQQNFEAFKWCIQNNKTAPKSLNGSYSYLYNQLIHQKNAKNMLKYIKDLGWAGEEVCFFEAVVERDKELANWLKENEFTCAKFPKWPLYTDLSWAEEEGYSIEKFNVEVLLMGRIKEFERFYLNSDAKLVKLNINLVTKKCPWEPRRCNQISKRVENWLQEHPNFELNSHLIHPIL